LHESEETPNQAALTKMKARIEIVADLEDQKQVAQFLKIHSAEQ
jgi:hypothetical protein